MNEFWYLFRVQFLKTVKDEVREYSNILSTCSLIHKIEQVLLSLASSVDKLVSPSETHQCDQMFSLSRASVEPSVSAIVICHHIRDISSSSDVVCLGLVKNINGKSSIFNGHLIRFPLPLLKPCRLSFKFCLLYFIRKLLVIFLSSFGKSFVFFYSVPSNVFSFWSKKKMQFYFIHFYYFRFMFYCSMHSSSLFHLYVSIHFDVSSIFFIQLSFLLKHSAILNAAELL